MTEASQGDDGPDEVTAVIATRVRALRRVLGLSGAQLAERLSRHGIHWNRSTAAKLETGRREAISVQELLALADVLGVPPMSLVEQGPAAGVEQVTPEVAFGARLRELRNAQGMTQAGLAGLAAARFGLTLDPSAIARLEKGQRAIRLNEAAALAVALGTCVGDILQEASDLL